MGGSLSPKESPKQGPGKMEPERGQETTGEGSLDHSKGSPEAPLGFPRGESPPDPSLPQTGVLREGDVSPLRPGLLTVGSCLPQVWYLKPELCLHLEMSKAPKSKAMPLPSRYLGLAALQAPTHLDTHLLLTAFTVKSFLPHQPVFTWSPFLLYLSLISLQGPVQSPPSLVPAASPPCPPVFLCYWARCSEALARSDPSFFFFLNQIIPRGRGPLLRCLLFHFPYSALHITGQSASEGWMV